MDDPDGAVNDFIGRLDTYLRGYQHCIEDITERALKTPQMTAVDFMVEVVRVLGNGPIEPIMEMLEPEDHIKC